MDLKINEALKKHDYIRSLNINDYKREAYNNWSLYSHYEEILRNAGYKREADEMHTFVMTGFRKEEWDADCL